MPVDKVCALTFLLYELTEQSTVLKFWEGPFFALRNPVSTCKGSWDYALMATGQLINAHSYEHFPFFKLHFYCKKYLIKFIKYYLQDDFCSLGKEKNMKISTLILF